MAWNPFWPPPERMRSDTLLHTSQLHRIKQLKAEVVFGTPSQNCAGSGVCMITPYRPFNMKKNSCIAVKAVLAKTDTGYLTMQLCRNDIPESIRKKYFLGSLFRVEESYSLPVEVVRSLGLSTQQIEPGLYPILEERQGWSICFTV